MAQWIGLQKILDVFGKEEVKLEAGNWYIDNEAVNASAAELDLLAGSGLSAAEVALLDGAGTGGTPVASKVQVADANQNIGDVKATELHIGTSGSETQVTATPAQLNAANPTIAAAGDLIVGDGAASTTALTVGSDGTVPVANAGDSAGIGYAFPNVGGIDSRTRALTSIKAATYDPLLATGSITLTDGALIATAVYMPFDATLTGVGWVQQTAGDTTADNNNRIGLATSDGTNLTLVASCADDGTLWEQSAGVVKKAFSGTYAASGGTVYWILALSNWSAAAQAPILAALDSNHDHSSLGAVSMSDTDERIHGIATSQADLPATTIAWSSVVASVASHEFFFVY